MTSTRVDRQRAARAERARIERETAGKLTREFARGEWHIAGAYQVGLALALVRSLPSRGNWSASLFGAGSACRLCGRKLRDRHVRRAHLSSCARRFLELWPVELAELLRRSYSADELAAIAAMCAGLASRKEAA